MTKFTDEMVDIVRAAHEEVKGTTDYGRYTVPLESKSTGKWKFVGWTPVTFSGEIKKSRNHNTYVYYKNGFGDEYRYELTDAVKVLLKMEDM